MNEVNPRVTMIMGAGAVLDMNFPCSLLRPSTWNITQEVIKPYANVFDKKKEITVVGDIYKRLMEVFPVNQNIWWENDLRPNIHFEILFHVMEQLMAYESVWKGINKNPDIFPHFAPFTSQNFDFHSDEIEANDVEVHNAVMRSNAMVIVGLFVW